MVIAVRSNTWMQSWSLVTWQHEGNPCRRALHKAQHVEILGAHFEVAFPRVHHQVSS